ncbi:PD40 domain-containing protein [Wocania ichthyoenteri]|uniref:PD40 domain-containing protein n=1 Tax=Wocania ichthyoenteri TaxID=1230531 RepID=UPI00053E3BB7|nr:PD40 domain-containing protein [Wocania ichthyoenteri]
MKLFYYLIFLIGCFGFSQVEKYKIIDLDINNQYPHFGLMYAANNKIIFTSYLLTKKGKIKKISGNPVLTIFQGELSESGQVINTKPITIDIKYGISHITSATISSDSKQLYLTTNYNDKDMPKGNFKDTNFHIKVGEFDEVLGWTNFKVLSFCKPKFSYGHPCLSQDGRTLYFVANIRGGKETTKGGSDIFKVDILENNKYTEPKNLGSKVNSYSREMFPFVSADNTLYFASNRPNGYGGFDYL